MPPPPPAPGAIIIMPPPAAADASTSKVSSMAFTSSEASSSVMVLSLSMTSSTTADMCTLEAATLDWHRAAGLTMYPEAHAKQADSRIWRNIVFTEGEREQAG